MENNYKVTFRNKGFNVAALNAGVGLPIQDQTNAEAFKNLPHNSFVLSNQDTACTLFLYLDDFSDADKPDYVLFPTQTIAVGVEDGISFTTLWVKNTHASSNVAAKAIKYNIMTVKKVE